MARLRPEPNDEVVRFDRRNVYAEVVVPDGKAMPYEEVCDEARSLLVFEVERVGGGFSPLKAGDDHV